MITDYPSYFEIFKCIGGNCKDSCCIGWELDIDDETFYRYRVVEGDFGRRLNEHMVDERDSKYFRLGEHKRCPMLNQDNLCDIILNLGEDALCTVCAEYPRYFVEVEGYQQIDLSLSCLESGRLFFSSANTFSFKRKLEEENRTIFIADVNQKEDGLSSLSKDVQEVISRRDREIALMQNRRKPFYVRLEELSYLNRFNNLFFHSEKETVSEIKNEIMKLCDEMEILEKRFPTCLMELRLLSDHEFYELLKDFIAEHNAMCAGYFEKLTVYLIFRYSMDVCFQDVRESIEAFIDRSLCLILFLSMIHWKKHSFFIEDIIDIAHLYSKQVEHDEKNVSILKRL
ncbi:MAG: flagellin lysine-N-methylase [Lachnospiraceae bacterium]|nr:flagellin lysine-N-methylase [Lachnospiraceae bacterium]